MNSTASSPNFWLIQCVLESGPSTDRNMQCWQSFSRYSCSTGKSPPCPPEGVSHLQKRHSDEIDKFALDLLPNILKKATKIPELGKVLKGHPLRTPQSKTDGLSGERFNAAKAVKEYWDVRILARSLCNLERR